MALPDADEGSVYAPMRTQGYETRRLRDELRLGIAALVKTVAKGPRDPAIELVYSHGLRRILDRFELVRAILKGRDACVGSKEQVPPGLSFGTVEQKHGV